jgi:hypothetical protein
MKQWLAIVAAVAFLALPIMVSADDDMSLPPEANWTPTPPASGLVAVPEKRVVSTEQEQATDSPRPTAVRQSSTSMALTPADAMYKAVNDTARGE